MATCRACGGILGRDCFNEQDCLSISENDRYDNDLLNYKIQILMDELKKHNIPIPDLNPKPIDFNYLYEADDLPY